MTCWLCHSPLHSPNFDDVLKLIRRYNPENILNFGSQHNFKKHGVQGSLCSLITYIRKNFELQYRWHHWNVMTSLKFGLFCNICASHLKLKSIPNGHMHSWTYGRVNARVHEKVFVLFQESFNATAIFLQLRHFLSDV